MNSCVIGTIELADQPIESLAPDHAPDATLPARIRRALEPTASLVPDHNADDLAPYIDDMIEADLSEIRRQLRYELCQIMRACEILGRKRPTAK
jgi:hypothetical protein